MVGHSEQALLDVILRYQSAIVAYSGGVDSTVVAEAAHRALGSRMLAVTADSPSLAREELTHAKYVAEQAGFSHRVVKTYELDNPEYRANDGRRCYFCKSELFATLTTLRDREGYQIVMDGFNVDDTSDYRPGLKAGQEWQVLSPLKEAGLDKAAVRALASHWGLSNWDKPASPCLSSRFPYHMPITIEAIQQVEMAEQALKVLGFNNVRVRHHHPVARIEVPVADMERLLRHREAVVEVVKHAGYLFVDLDLMGLRSGSLNALLEKGVKSPIPDTRSGAPQK